MDLLVTYSTYCKAFIRRQANCNCKIYPGINMDSEIKKFLAIKQRNAKREGRDKEKEDMHMMCNVYWYNLKQE